MAATLRPGNVPSAKGWEEVLFPIVDRLRDQQQTVVVRADAAFALPAIYEALERRGVRYAIRLPANDILERAIEDLPVRPRGRPSHAPLIRYRSFRSWLSLVAVGPRRPPDTETHLGELFPRVGFIVRALTGTNRPVVHFYNQRRTAEQWIKEGKTAIHWTRLSCHRFRANEVRLLLGVIAYNLGNLLRRLVLPAPSRAGHSRARNSPCSRRAADPAGAVLHPATRRKLLDGEPLSADSPAHRAARVAPDVIASPAERRR